MNSLKDKCEALEVALPFLNEGDKKFANDLINGKYGYKARGSLSPNQVVWVDKLIARALNQNIAGAPVKTDVGSFAAVYALFAAAKKNLKFPRIRLLIQDLPICLSLAGPKSKYAGAVQVTDGGKYGSNRYFGRVDKDGSFTPSNSQADQAEKVAGILKLLANDPVGTAKQHGKLTGYCCFCNLALTDPQSVAAGFGAKCASNYGLLAQYKSAEAVL